MAFAIAIETTTGKELEPQYLVAIRSPYERGMRQVSIRKASSESN